MSRCTHTPIAGPWLSAAHLSRCLGVPRAELISAAVEGQIASRVVGRQPRQAIQVRAADAVERWPAAFCTFCDTPKNARVRKGLG